jgi:hypothetical protein
MAFTLLLSLLVALPSFGIDMSLPALTATGAALGVAPAQAGMMMSLFKAAGAPGNSTTGIPLTVRPRPVVSPNEAPRHGSRVHPCRQAQLPSDHRVPAQSRQ